MIGRASTLRQIAFAAAALGVAAVQPAPADETLLDFRAPFYDPLPAGFFPTMAKPIDFDGDGFVDLAVAGRDPDDRLVTMSGIGNGHFMPRQTLFAGGFVDWLDIADLDGDGDDDIVAAWRGGAGKLVMYPGIGVGIFGEPVELLALGRDPQGIALGDFDGDRDVDVAVSLYIGSAVDIHTNDGAGALELTARVRLGQFFGGFAYPRLVQAGDLDGDGDLDLVSNELGGSRVAVLRNESGRFGRAVEYRTPIIGDERPGISCVQLVDIDADGDLDAVCPAILLNSTQKVLAFVNDGTGRMGTTIVGEGSPQGYAFEIEIADFDGDGDMDAASGTALPGAIVVSRRLNGTPFEFEPDELLFYGSLVRHLTAVDVDGDCDLDLVGVEGPAQSVITSLNRTPPDGCGGVAGAEAGSSRKREQPEPGRGDAPRVDRNGDGVFDATDVAVWLTELSQPVVAPGAGEKPVAKGGAR